MTFLQNDYISLYSGLTRTEIKAKLRLLRTEVRIKIALIDKLIEQWEVLELTEQRKNIPTLSEKEFLYEEKRN